MFTMNDMIRKSFDSNMAMGRAFSGQMMDFQTAAALNTQKQFNSAFDGFRGMMELSHKTVRAMQQTVADQVDAVVADTAA
jgi:hypothetical protein